MIYLNPPYLNINGLAIFGDQADSAQWYYCPSKPRLALTPEGKPMFMLVRRAPDPAAPPGPAGTGASLNFAVNLSVDEQALASVAQEMSKQLKLEQPPLLAPIQYSAGTTRLVFLEAAAPASGTATSVADFIEKTSNDVTPSLYGNQDAAYMFTLSAEGFMLLEAIISGKAPPLVGVVYDLAFQATRPALDAGLNVSWDQVNADLSSKFGAPAGARRLAPKTDIDAAVKALIAKQAVTVTGQAPAAIDWVQTFITNTFFTPSLTPPGFDVAAYSFKGVTQDELKDLDAELNAGSVIEGRLAPQARLSELTAPYPAGGLITTFNLA